MEGRLRGIVGVGAAVGAAAVDVVVGVCAPAEVKGHRRF